jgi:hypothetical protein
MMFFPLIFNSYIKICSFYHLIYVRGKAWFRLFDSSVVEFIYLLTCELMSSGLRMAKNTPIYYIKLYNK